MTKGARTHKRSNQGFASSKYDPEKRRAAQSKGGKAPVPKGFAKMSLEKRLEVARKGGLAWSPTTCYTNLCNIWINKSRKRKRNIFASGVGCKLKEAKSIYDFHHDSLCHRITTIRCVRRNPASHKGLLYVPRSPIPLPFSCINRTSVLYASLTTLEAI